MRQGNQRTLPLWLGAIGFMLLPSGVTAFSQLRDGNHTESAPMQGSDERRRFIAAFDWSVERSRYFVWPFESMRPAPYESVWMVVERMPRAWPEKSRGKGSISLSAYGSLRINGRSLPKPKRMTGSQEEFRIYLEQGRLRLSFSLPSGFKLDPQYTVIRIKLYQVG